MISCTHVLAKDCIKELLVTDTDGIFIGVFAIGTFPNFHTTIDADANIFLLHITWKIV